MSFGLIEPKKLLAASPADEPIDPDLEAANEEPTADPTVILTNLSVSLDQVYNEWAKVYTVMQNTYKYTLATSQKRLQVGSCFSTRNNFLTFRWAFYTGAGATKKFYKRLDQQAVAFVRPDPAAAGGIIVVLRPRSGKPLDKDLLDLLAAEGVDVTPLPAPEAQRRAAAPAPELAAPAAPTEPAKPTAEELKRLEEEKKRLEEERLAEEAREAARKAEEEAARKPLPFAPAPKFDDQRFSSEMSMFLGELNDEDFNAPLDLDVKAVEAAMAGASAPAPAVPIDEAPLVESPAPPPTKEQMNALGQAAFQADEIHEQIFTLYEQVVEYFKPVMNVLVATPGAPAGVVAKLHSTVFCVNDVQWLFENDFTEVNNLHEAIVQIFPLSSVSSSTLPQDLWIQSYNTGEFIDITDPAHFSFIGHMRQKDNFGYIFNKCKLCCQEKVARTNRHMDSMVDLLFVKLTDIITVLREKRSYASMVKNPAALSEPLPLPAIMEAGAPAPVAPAAPAEPPKVEAAPQPIVVVLPAEIAQTPPPPPQPLPALPAVVLEAVQAPAAVLPPPMPIKVPSPVAVVTPAPVSAQSAKSVRASPARAPLLPIPRFVRPRVVPTPAARTVASSSSITSVNGDVSSTINLLRNLHKSQPAQASGRSPLVERMEQMDEEEEDANVSDLSEDEDSEELF